jgi:hypothetical protein
VAYIAAEHAALIEEIRCAFADVDRIDGVSLREAEVLDGYGSVWEQAAARELDIDDHWTAVSDRDLQRYGNKLNFLDTIGLRYYLPAYMSWMLRLHPDYGPSAESSLLFILTRCDPRDGWWVQRSKAFSPAQNAVICRFLEFLSDYSGVRRVESDAREALNLYWNRFRGDRT